MGLVDIVQIIVNYNESIFPACLGKTRFLELHELRKVRVDGRSAMSQRLYIFGQLEFSRCLPVIELGDVHGQQAFQLG